MTISLRNKIAVVTGASSGIGKAIALGLAAECVSLRLIGRNLEKLDAVASMVKSPKTVVKTYGADLSEDDDIYRFVEHLKADSGNISLLIHSAGDFSMGLIESSSVADFDRQYRVNVRAPYLLTQLILPMMKPHDGQIVFINSSVGLKAKAGVSQYAATKHALRAIADSLREEVNDDGIRVLSVFPGRTATPMQETVHQKEGKAYKPERFMQPEDVAAVVINALVLPRNAEATDIHIRPMHKF